MWLRALSFAALAVGLADAAADITAVSVQLEDEYVVSTTPTKVIIKTTHTTAVPSGPVVYTFDTILFAGSAATPICTASLTNPGTATFACQTGVGAMHGNKLTAVLTSGQIGAGQTLTLTVTRSVAGDIAQLPAIAQIVKLTAVEANNGADSLAGGMGGFSAFETIAAPTITPTTLNLNSYTTPTSVRVLVKAAFTGANSAIIKVVCNKAIFQTGQTSGLTMTGITPSSYQSDGTGTTVSITAPGSGIPRGTDLNMLFHGAMMTQLPPDGGPVLFTVKVDDHNICLEEAGFGSINVIVGSGADPIARFGDSVVEFELPPNVLTPLVSAPHAASSLVIHGSVFEGGGPWEQWFNRMVLVYEDRFVDIGMKANLHELNRSKVPRGDFQAMEVTIGHGNLSNPIYTEKLQAVSHQIPFGFLGAQIAFRSLRRNHFTKYTTVGNFPRECADIATQAVHLYICSAPATEYYGKQRDFTLKYAHLDMTLMEGNYKALTGLLPELWGLHPMSESTKAYVKETAPSLPKPEVAGGGSKEASTGGFGIMQNFDKECLEATSNDTILTV